MFRKIRIAALSALMGLGTLSAMPASAQAEGIYFSFGQSGAHIQIRDRDRDRFHRPRHHRQRHASACTPRQALHKAARMGIRHARITRANRNIIRVSGHRHRHATRVVFARAPHCPVIRSM